MSSGLASRFPIDKRGIAILRKERMMNENPKFSGIDPPRTNGRLDGMRPQSALRLFGFLAALFCCFFITAYAGVPFWEAVCSWGDDSEEMPVSEWIKMAPIDQTLHDWLASQERGEDGLEYWANKSYVHPVTLYTVMDYKVVDDRSSVERVVRIHSTTKGGSPIVQLWRICIIDRKITSVRLAQED